MNSHSTSSKTAAHADGARHAGSIKTILVPIGGSETDRAVLATALNIARPLQAHLQFLHIRPTPSPASVLASDFGALRGIIDPVERQLMNRDVSASQYAEFFCREHGIDYSVEPGHPQVTAECREASGPPIATLLSHARLSDLIIMGRRQHVEGMPYNLIEEVLINSGRPLLIAPRINPVNLLGTVLIGWKESPSSVRALSAAMPLLKLARRVVVVHVAEEQSLPPPLDLVCQQLAWHGITAEPLHAGDGTVSAATALPQIATELKAGLMVVGGFARSRLLEKVIGSVTRHLLDSATLPVFMTH